MRKGQRREGRDPSLCRAAAKLALGAKVATSAILTGEGEGGQLRLGGQREGRQLPAMCQPIGGQVSERLS